MVHRDPEFTDADRARIFALLAYDAACCGSCGAFDTVVELPSGRRHVTWEEHGGVVIDVRQYRCLTCGAVAIINRDFGESTAKRPHQTGVASPGDGRMAVGRPLAP